MNHAKGTAMTVAKYRLLTFFSFCALLILCLLWYLD